MEGLTLSTECCRRAGCPVHAAREMLSIALRPKFILWTVNGVCSLPPDRLWPKFGWQFAYVLGYLA
eukprot:352834-Chlamydomonas_euryale.AAC.2